ncbi:MAG TPA: amidohydrolase [Gammaproteobacteria bacterium]|nr:amidohydrolase [Gammaproteobacteria bacterium]
MPALPALDRLLLHAALCAVLAAAQAAQAASGELADSIGRRAAEVEDQVIAWRRDFHEHPELSNREVRTAKVIAGELDAMGMDVETGIAHTGVVALLEGGRPGPLVALRADMDALPVAEKVDLPFASKAMGEYRGERTRVMHACGHDAHMAILLGVARSLSGERERLPGSVLFIFQPAEEGAPNGEEGGAALMLEEGLFEARKPDAIFGLHVWSALPAGVIGYRAGPAMASSDRFRLVVHGRQTHGSKPWAGVDPIVVAAQIVLGLQTIASRQVDVTANPSVVSVGRISGGIRNNIIPDEVEMLGTVRAFDEAMRRDIHARLENTATHIAQSAGATVDVDIDLGYPVTVNDPELTGRTLDALRAAAGDDRVREMALVTGAEDFSYFQQQVPGFYFFLGVTPEGTDPASAPANHSPLFFIDESALVTGVRALTNATLDYLQAPPPSG